jgi:peptidoglycan/LPS O-acetylase OafA/YrhL
LTVAAVALSRIARPTTPATGIIVFFGDMSYALYLTHNIVLPLAVPAVASIVQPVQPWLCGTAMFAVCVIVGAATYLLLEWPITQALQKLLSLYPEIVRRYWRPVLLCIAAPRPQSSDYRAARSFAVRQ